MRFEHIESKRLNLVPIHRDHADAMFDGLQSPELYEFMNKQPPASRAALADEYARLATTASPDGRETWLNWLVQSRESGAFLGFVQARVRDSRATVGYMIFTAHWGNGYAPEAFAAMLRALRDAGVNEFIATVHTENHTSIRLLKRAGFTMREMRRNADTIRGVSTDEYDFASN